MKPQMISFRCILKDGLGKTMKDSMKHEVLNAVEDEASLLSGLSQGLQNLKKGERREISLSADQAYGASDPKKIIYFPRLKIDNHRTLACGDSVSIVSKTGVTRAYRVLQIHGDMLRLDGNHPLAGQDLIFDIEATDVREATPVEVANPRNQISKLELH